MSLCKAVDRICRAVSLKGDMNTGELCQVILEEGITYRELEDLVWQCRIESIAREIQDKPGAWLRSEIA